MNTRRPPEANHPAYRGDIAIAHASVVVFGVGVFIAAAIWVLRKDESRRTAFQAAQAAIWQSLFVLVMLLASRISSRFLLIALIGDIVAGGTSGSTVALICARALMVLFAAPFVVLGLYASFATWQGIDFRYPLVSDWVERRQAAK